MPYLFAPKNGKWLVYGREVKNCTTQLPVLSSVAAYQLYYSNFFGGGRITFINFCALSTVKGMILSMNEPFLSIRDLHISFSRYTPKLTIEQITPVRSLNIEIYRGEILAVVGASGSGKSLLAHAIMGILPSNAKMSGEIYYDGQPLMPKKIKQLQGEKIAFIPQSINYLDPLMKVKKQVQIGLPKKGKKKIQESLFEAYDLQKQDGDLYPFQLSGGMLRRVLFATSVRDSVKLVIADEPTPGIHVEALDKVLKQLRVFADNGMAVLLITHDILSALSISDRVTIMKDGTALETASANKFEGRGEQLKTSYAKALWRALPTNDFLHAEGLDNVTM